MWFSIFNIGYTSAIPDSSFWKINLIIRRYLVKQVVSTSLVVVTLLTVIMMGGQLIKRFGQAAMGRVDPSILLVIACLSF